MSILRTAVWPVYAPGAAIGTPPLALAWPEKSAGDVLDYSADLTVFLADVQDTIASVTASISPSGPTLSKEGTPNGLQATCWVGGGTVGTIYVLTLIVTTTAGRIVTVTGTIPVGSATVPVTPQLLGALPIVPATASTYLVTGDDGGALAPLVAAVSAAFAAWTATLQTSPTSPTTLPVGGFWMDSGVLTQVLS